MKASTDFKARLAEAIAPLDTRIARAEYRELRIPRAESVKDLNVRYRWDLLWLAAKIDRSIYDEITAEDLGTDHLDTVLRAIVSPL